MALTEKQAAELMHLLDVRDAAKAMFSKEANDRLRKLALDPIKRRKTFKIVPGAALSREAARLAQFYEQARPEQRAALDTLMTMFTVGAMGATNLV